MDIYSFINSRDIREHLTKIKYSFNSLERAWLIYSCRALTYEERKNAWLELLQTMPDCPVPKRPNCAGWDSLHDMIREYVNAIEGEIVEFHENRPEDRNVYMYSYLYDGDGSWTEEYETVYGTLEKCVDAYKKDVAEFGSFSEVMAYRIKKQSLTDTQRSMVLEYDAGDRLRTVIYKYPMEKREQEILHESFEGLWFDFPTPFQKGDLVWDPAAEKNRLCGGPFALEGLSTWDPLECIVQSGDNSDMNGYGYFLWEDGSVYHEVMHNYMDLEYYPEPYEKNERILPVLGKFLKKEVDLEILLQAYYKCMLDVAVGDE